MKEEWYTAINPNGRVPAIIHVKEDGTSVPVFESAACLLYMANEFDKEHKLSYPFGTPDYWQQVAWVSDASSSFLENLSDVLSHSCHGRSHTTVLRSAKQPTSIGIRLSRRRTGRCVSRLSADGSNMYWTSSS